MVTIFTRQSLDAFFADQHPPTSQELPYRVLQCNLHPTEGCTVMYMEPGYLDVYCQGCLSLLCRVAVQSA